MQLKDRAPRNHPARFLLILLVLVGLAGAASVLTAPSTAPLKNPPRLLTTNEAFINGLYAGLDYSDKMAVFAYVFASLNDEVTVYPSENYYYFEFPARGKTLTGSLSFFPSERDSNQVGFGYALKLEDKARHRHYFLRGSGGSLSEKEGVTLKNIDPLTLSVIYEGKTVLFHFYTPPLVPPQKASLRADEEFVASTLDESGLRFHLLFNTTTARLFWILNEDGFVAETFTRSHRFPDVVLGDRTEFAFYDDSLHTRKVLIGVGGLNVLHNNWYDGPFDQLPDNYVYTGQISLKPYLMAHYGVDSTAIDDYGNFSKDSRIPVAPYVVYFEMDALAFVDSCKTRRPDEAAFYACLTEQHYEIPDDFYDEVYRKYY